MAALVVPLASFPSLFGDYGPSVFPYLGTDTFRTVEGVALSYRDERARNLLVLVPAAECIDEADERVAGSRDSGLSARGRAQALAAGRALRAVIAEKGCHALFTSKMRRARETLDLLCQGAGIAAGGVNDDLEIRTAPALNERLLGVLEGRNRHVLKDLYGAELLEMYEGSALSIAPPGGESIGGLMNTRVAPYLERAILPSIAGSRTRLAIVVAHPDVLRAMQLSINGRRTQTAIADAAMRSGGPPRVLTVDRTGRWITSEDVDLPSLPPIRHDSIASTGSTATESSIATPPPSIHVGPAASARAGPSKQKIEDHIKEHDAEVYHDAPAELYIPLVAKPASGSRFVEGPMAAVERRISIPGKSQSLRTLQLPGTVTAAEAFHGAPVSSVIRLAA